ncbi:MAG TPA: DHA2 family efflux MFS transporter permease subunit, partial [Acidimicrobiales bacterium]|nr:DHA2 family efflux MFS transporter permease subunit [Acidimicrobiales bacterium]
MHLPEVSQKRSAAIVYGLAVFMSAMDITIVNVTLATLGHEFHVTPQGTDAVAISFVVSLAVFIPASGWLGDRFGTKRVLLAAIAIFTLASALCGLAQSLPQLVVFRALQGVGGGLLMPVGMAVLWRAYPPAERIAVARLVMLPIAIGPALGPVLGGVLTTFLSWRWVFFVNLPIGIFTLVFGLVYLREHKEPEAGRFDLPGFVLAGVGFGCLMYAISAGASKGWGSPGIVLTGVLGVVMISALIVVELRVRQPMLDLRLMKNRLFRTTTIVSFVSAGAFFGILYLVALYFQDGLGMSPFQAGLTTFPEAFGVMVGSQISTRMVARVGPRRTLAGGLTG